MRVVIATEPATPDRENEDWATATPDLVVVLDGATARTDTGCIHGIAWYANKLGAAIIGAAADHHQSLSNALAVAISDVAGMHPQCNLDHPGTPSAAVGILRIATSAIEFLALADVAIATRDWSGRIAVALDDRADRAASRERARALALPIGEPGREAALDTMKRAQQALRNRSGGYYVAAADPSVVREALTWTAPRASISAAALLTDGATRAVNLFHILDWERLFKVCETSGPASLIAMARASEDSDPHGMRWSRTKRSDDATVAFAFCERAHPPRSTPRSRGSNLALGRPQAARQAGRSFGPGQTANPGSALDPNHLNTSHPDQAHRATGNSTPPRYGDLSSHNFA